MASLTGGEIDIPMDGGSAVLTANLYAATRISRHFGGFQEALNRIGKGDLDAMTVVVRYGMGLKTDAEAKGLDERVFAAGVLRLTSPLTEFLLVLANGGRSVSEEAEPPAVQPGEAAD
jgi:hypothetical protein